MSISQTLRDRLLDYETALNDNEDIYAGNALKNGKGLEKAQKARKNLGNGNNEEALVVIDSTVWGSVSEGFYITENHIHGKELYEDSHSFCISDIHTIHVNSDEKSMTINGISIKWLGDGVAPKAKIIAQCIQDHINSRTKRSSVQDGRLAHLKQLKKQLFDLHASVCDWGLTITSRISDVQMDNMNHMPMGGESFLDRMSIAASRSKALETYDNLKKEADARIHSLNKAVPVDHANKELIDDGFEKVVFSFDFHRGPDRNTSISNEDWNSNADDAFYKLMDCGSHLMQKISDLTDKLSEIQKEESDDGD